ncbi:filamentous hemagglutinin N-terminal domain-containing protein [Mannheimia massilioguelmaensis]|uniref:filamentous hemagglutinin N-terminal domain-containing protein n=1 Tax=Mannheimia massilioguelmaensis TaxID=1604354 RepID=UPI0005CB3F73|nr:filamentous hemagglutinin N-terminal domain-containing protein [Mannheimia massilioguelmaensis]
MFKLNTISLLVITACYGIVYATPADLPQNHKIIVGNAKVSNTVDKMTVDQTSNKVQINWDSFDIGKNKEVKFNQPTTNSVAYNRVIGGNASQIQGKLTSNGKVYLANPNGIIITKNSEINVGGLLATTKDLEKISDKEGSEDKFTRKKAKEGQILNQGKIKATGERAFVVLAGDNIKNEGKIEADNYYFKETKTVRECYDDPWSYPSHYCYDWPVETVKSSIGEVYLASGENVAITFTDRLLDIALDENTVKGIVQNDGAIISKGDITLNARGKSAALDSLVVNNGTLQANTANRKGGTIILSAGDITLDKNSNIKAEEKVEFGHQASIYDPKPNIKVTSKEGSKITTPALNIRGKTVDLRGKVGRDESDEHYNDEFKTLNTAINIEIEGAIHTGNERTNTKDSFIQAETLASLLGSNGRVNMRAKGFKLSGDINVESFKNTDSILKLSTPNNIDMENLNINSKNRLFIIGALDNESWNNNQFSNLSIKNANINLGNGAMGLGRGSGSSNIMSDYKLNPFSLAMNNVKFTNVDDFVVTGGFTKVDINNLTGDGQTNYYINAGNTRPNPYTKVLKYEYGVRNLDERTLRSSLNQNVRRWKYSSDLYDDIDYEYNHYFELYSARTNKRDFIPNTEININNTDLNLTNGFVHLMAEKINLDKTNINIAFDKNTTSDPSVQMNRVGINGNTTMKDSHIKVIGAELQGVSPARRYAGFYILGGIEGENSSIFVKTHQGNTFRSDNATLAGKNNKDDLKITVINTGGRAAGEIRGPDGMLMSADNDANAGNVAFDSGDSAYTRTNIKNATVVALSPNGAVAYASMSDRTGTGIDVDPSASFTFFELPRNTKFLEMDIKGDTTKLNYRDFARLYDNMKGIKASTLSQQQLGIIDSDKKTLKDDKVNELYIEKTVAMTICDENNQCEERLLGSKNTNATVSVGDVKSE